MRAAHIRAVLNTCLQMLTCRCDATCPSQGARTCACVTISFDLHRSRLSTATNMQASCARVTLHVVGSVLHNVCVKTVCVCVESTAGWTAFACHKCAAMHGR